MYRCKKHVSVILFILLMCMTADVSAAYNQYSGAANGSWNTAGNWALGTVPTTADKAGFKTAGGPLVTSSTPTCDQWTLGGSSGGLVTINSGGSVQTNGRVALGQSAGESGTLTMNGGTATFGGVLDLGYAGTGHINLNGGTINAASFAMRSSGGTGTMNITGGTLIVTGDAASTINGYVSSGWITAYSGSGTVNVSYNTPNAGKTTVTASGGGSPPAQATSPSPANSATGVSTSATLSWTAGSGATSHDVYFGTDSTPDSGEFQGNQSGTTYNPGTMANSTTYYWRIDEKNTYGTTTGTVWSFTTTAGGGGGTVYPYLTYRNTPANSIVVNWWNPNETGDSSVDYGLTSSYGSTTNVATITNYHHVELTGLASGTTYHYRIRSNDGTVGADNTFTTAVANTTSFGFAVFGDGRGISGDSTVYYARHQALCNWVAAQNNIKFILDSGDIVWEGASTTSLVDYWPDYFQLESTLSKSKVKMNTLGNHEVQPTGAGTPLERYQNYKNFYAAGFPANGVGGNYEGQVYSFNYGNAHFVCLSSYQAPFDDQTTWLSADLAAASADPSIEWIFVWMHDPLYTTSSTHPPDTTEQAWWGPIFDEYQVDIVFAGHNHVYERSKSIVNGAVVPDNEGTVYITSGLAGANFDPISSHPLFITSYNSQTLAACVTINGNNLTVNAITNADSIVRDTFTLSHGTLPLPGQASNPSPANGATNVATSATLSWTAGSNATSHDVYFGTDSTPDSGEFIGNQSGTTYNPTMANSTTYYWRIDEKNATGTTTGTVWNFTTAAAGGITYVEWNGSVSSNWNTAGNWNGGAVPNTSNKAGFKTATGPVVTASTPTCDQWTLGGSSGGLVTINSGGSVQTNSRVGMGQSAGESGTLTMNGGTATFGGILDLGYAGTGHINLDGGTINAASFAMRASGGTGTMDITGGTLIVDGDAASTINGYVSSGWITAYSGSGTVNVSYNTPNSGKTTVTASSGGSGALPFSDGFESGDFTAGGWTTLDADASITSTSADRYAGTYGAKLRQTTWMQKAISTAGYNTIHVKYARKATGLDSGQGEKLFVEWSIDGTTWNNLETTGTTAWTLKDFTCGSGANNNANFRVRFRINASATSEFGAVDSVEITGTSQ